MITRLIIVRADIDILDNGGDTDLPTYSGRILLSDGVDNIQVLWDGNGNDRDKLVGQIDSVMTEISESVITTQSVRGSGSDGY